MSTVIGQFYTVGNAVHKTKIVAPSVNSLVPSSGSTQTVTCKISKKLIMLQCQFIVSEVTRGSKPLFAHVTNGTEMPISSVFFLNLYFFFYYV